MILLRYNTFSYELTISHFVHLYSKLYIVSCTDLDHTFLGCRNGSVTLFNKKNKKVKRTKFGISTKTLQNVERRRWLGRFLQLLKKRDKKGVVEDYYYISSFEFTIFPPFFSFILYSSYTLLLD